MIDGITYVPLTDIGVEREENQDYQGHDLTSFGLLFIVADGMGGHAGGATASQMTVNHLKRALRTSDQASPSKALENAIRQANYDIWLTSQERFDLRGMGSTVVALLINEQIAHIAHVGDSRIYLLRGETFMQLTKDHTMVQRMLDDGLLTEEAARHHPTSHVLSRSLGGTKDVLVETSPYPIRLQEGDLFLLCSDGLTGPVEDWEISQILLEYELHDAARILVDLANERGGLDNSTIALIRIDALPVTHTHVLPTPPPAAPEPIPDAAILSAEEDPASEDEDGDPDEEADEEGAEEDPTDEAPSTEDEASDAADEETDGDNKGDSETESGDDEASDAVDEGEEDESAEEEDAEEDEEDSAEDDPAPEPEEEDAEGEPEDQDEDLDGSPSQDQEGDYLDVDELGAIDPSLIAYSIMDATRQGTKILPPQPLAPLTNPPPHAIGQQSPQSRYTIPLIVAAAALALGVLLGFMVGHDRVPVLEEQFGRANERLATSQVSIDTLTKDLEASVQATGDAEEKNLGLTSERDALKLKVDELDAQLTAERATVLELQQELDAARVNDEQPPP